LRLHANHLSDVVAERHKGAAMRKAERHSFILRRAWELAETGQYANWLFVEIALRQEGHHEAPGVLDKESERYLLDVMCERATGKPAWGDKFTHEKIVRIAS